MIYTRPDAYRTIRKWLNEDIISPIDKQALATVLEHYSEMLDEKAYPYTDDELYSDKCPDCGSLLISASGGGVKCSSRSCSYWFCF